MERKKHRKPLSWYLPKILVYAILLLFVFIAVMPLVVMWVNAFRPKLEVGMLDPFSIPESVTFDNIIKAWTVGRMSTYMKNSILVAVPRVLVVLLLSSMAGFAFGKLRWKGRNAFFSYILVGMMIPIQAMIIPIFYNLQGMGLINSLWSMILPYFGISMPFACFMMRSFYRDLPDEVMEAARIDGCNKFRMWWHIMMPLTKPALVSLLIFEFMWSWNDYLLPSLMVFNDAFRTMPLGLNYFRGEYTSDQTLIAAGVTICTVPIILVYTAFQRTFVDGITAGAVKG